MHFILYYYFILHYPAFYCEHAFINIKLFAFNNTWYIIINGTTEQESEDLISTNATQYNIKNSDSNENKVATELNNILPIEATPLGLVNTENEVGDHLRSCYCDQHVGESLTYLCTWTFNQSIHPDYTSNISDIENWKCDKYAYNFSTRNPPPI